MHTLTLTKRLAAPIDRVFGAWTKAEEVRRWFAPGDMHVPEASVDCRVGGRYRIVMEDTDGSQHIVAGEYREIVANERLAFTWQWEGSEAVTFVELDFRAADGGGTEIKLVHTRFATEEQRDLHGEGWGDCLASLHTHVAHWGRTT